MDGAEGLRGFRRGVCGIPVRLRISQRAAPGTTYRDRAFAACGETAWVFPRADQGARASGWWAFGDGTSGGCGFMAGVSGQSAGRGGGGRGTGVAVSASGLAGAADVLRGAAAFRGGTGQRVLSIVCRRRIVCAGALRLAGVVHSISAYGRRKRFGCVPAALAAWTVEAGASHRSGSFVAYGIAGELELRPVAGWQHRAVLHMRSDANVPGGRHAGSRRGRNPPGDAASVAGDDAGSYVDRAVISSRFFQRVWPRSD